MEVKQEVLFSPPLEEVASVLQKGLSSYFSSVSVHVKPCPNLSESPFALAGKGLSGSEAILDIGGPKFLLPLVNREKTYSISNIMELSKFGDPWFVLGAGAGPFHKFGKNAELVADCSTCSGDVKKNNRIISLDDKNEKSIVSVADNDDFGLMLNLFASNGNSGEVLEIICEHRLSDQISDDHNFANRIRDVLVAHYGPEKPVGLGGIFIFEQGTAQLHVMPDFSKSPLCCEADVNSWLKFFNMEAPFVAAGELVSSDPGLGLRLEHFHCFKPGSTTDGGHFHIDTTPKTARYRAYFNVAKRLVRVDQPNN